MDHFPFFIGKILIQTFHFMGLIVYSHHFNQIFLSHVSFGDKLNLPWPMAESPKLGNLGFLNLFTQEITYTKTQKQNT